MADLDYQKYKAYIAKKLKSLIPIFAKASIGDFTQDVDIPETDDEFSETYTGIQIMLDVIRDKIHKLEASYARDEAILDDIDEGLIVTDAEGRITIMNPAAEAMLRYRTRDINHQLMHKVIQMEDENTNPVSIENRPVTKTLTSGKKTTAIYYYKRSDNTRFPARVTVTPLIINRQIVGSIGVFRDITAEKELSRMKDEFIGIVSHELKTPLTSIKVFTQVLQNKFAKAGDEKSVLLFSKMEIQLNKLTSLVSDLLDITKIETGKLKFSVTYFDINELIYEVVEEIQRTTDKHTIVKTLDKSKTILGNRDRIGQVLTNLLSNAIKYSPERGKILVKSQIKTEEIIVSVRDFGVGIPRKKQKRLFERYYRVEDKKRNTFPGMGLGLYISAEIIKRHHGRIWAESIDRKGSTFYFSLPIKQDSLVPEK